MSLPVESVQDTTLPMKIYVHKTKKAEGNKIFLFLSGLQSLELNDTLTLKQFKGFCLLDIGGNELLPSCNRWECASIFLPLVGMSFCLLAIGGNELRSSCHWWEWIYAFCHWWEWAYAFLPSVGMSFYFLAPGGKWANAFLPLVGMSFCLLAVGGSGLLPSCLWRNWVPAFMPLLSLSFCLLAIARTGLLIWESIVSLILVSLCSSLLAACESWPFSSCYW